MGIGGGYHFRVLRVDLSRGEGERVPISAQFALDHIGGPGFGAALLADHIREGAAALGPENVLVFSPGPLTGLLLPGAARCHVMARAPETGRIGGGNIGGDLGPAIRRAGYDAVVIVGRAPALSYLRISDGGVRVLPASHLAGLSAAAVDRAIRGELERQQLAVAAIGPAGETQSASAIISSGQHHCASGMGAVMGSRKLKAIAVSGSKALPVADPARLEALAERLRAEARCPADCEAGCVFKWLGPSGRHGGRLGRPSHDPALSPSLAGFKSPAPRADELGVDMRAAAARRRPPTPEMMLLDLLGLCYQPWLEMDGGIGLAAECYQAVTGVERTAEGLLDAARALQQLIDQ